MYNCSKKICQNLTQSYHKNFLLFYNHLIKENFLFVCSNKLQEIITASNVNVITLVKNNNKKRNLDGKWWKVQRKVAETYVV